LKELVPRPLRHFSGVDFDFCGRIEKNRFEFDFIDGINSIFSRNEKIDLRRSRIENANWGLNFHRAKSVLPPA